MPRRARDQPLHHLLYCASVPVTEENTTRHMFPARSNPSSSSSSSSSSPSPFSAVYPTPTPPPPLSLPAVPPPSLAPVSPSLTPLSPSLILNLLSPRLSSHPPPPLRTHTPLRAHTPLHALRRKTTKPKASSYAGPRRVRAYGAKARSSHTLHTQTHTPSAIAVATALFSPDISTKTASDLLIKLSEATQRAMKPVAGVDQEAQGEELQAGQDEQQGEPGLALSPDGPGASPEPPTLSQSLSLAAGEEEAHSTMASQLLRTLAERQECTVQMLKVKEEEEEPIEVNSTVTSDPALNPRDPTTDNLLVPKMEVRFLSGSKMADQLLAAPKMEEDVLQTVFCQDVSVKLASVLLHQLSEKVNKASHQTEHRTLLNRSPLEVRSNPPAPLEPSAQPPTDRLLQESKTSLQGLSRCYLFFYRCHVCGFETEGSGLFLGHMTEHRQWESGSFSLRCSVCDHSTNQEAEMRTHVETHTPGSQPLLENRCPPSSSGPVAMDTHPLTKHRCRICQRSFPGQQELQVHFQAHRQGNQYRCERCGHLTRTANKLIEHVRVHTGERPFTCDLCPYSAKRRDSLRLHQRVKHPTHRDVHTHRSYGPARRLHTPQHTHTSSSSSSPLSVHLSPFLPLTTLFSLSLPHPRPMPPSSSSSSSPSDKQSFLAYFGLTGGP